MVEDEREWGHHLRMTRPAALLTLVLIGFGTAASGADLQASGFVSLRAASAPDEGPLAYEELAADLQLGLDWFVTPRYLAHVHLLARGDEKGRRGKVGLAEAWVEGNFTPRGDRLRIRAGAFFLPTSRENVDALWENPYTITSSALNSWLGEELRPVGVDAAYYRRGSGLFGGATVYRGNDTLGALPPVRGWQMHDRWTLLGEWVKVDEEAFTSVSAETDGRLGWSARGGWRSDRFYLQLTRFDNRSDALEYGELYNWRTRFDIAAIEYRTPVWTFAAESGWGPTTIIVDSIPFTSDLRASYLLISRRWERARVSVRADEFDDGEEEGTALTLAAFVTPPGAWTAGIELTSSEGDTRVLFDLRYSLRIR